MNHHEKLQAFYRHAESIGLDRATAAPPLWHAMWRLGWRVPPPMFLGFWPLALGTGTAFGVLWGLAMWAMSLLGGAPTTAWAAARAGACFGLLFAALVRMKVRRYGLPRWSEYTGA